MLNGEVGTNIKASMMISLLSVFTMLVIVTRITDKKPISGGPVRAAGISCTVLCNKVTGCTTVCPTGIPTKVPPTPTLNPRKIKLGAIKVTSSSGVNPDLLINKIRTLLSENQGVDLIVTPEYSLYKGYENDPVVVNCVQNTCTISATNTGKSTTLLNTILRVEGLAERYKTNIVLGTVAEIEYANIDPNLKSNIVYNTQLIINNTGTVIGKKRKTTEWYVSNQIYSTECGSYLSNAQCYLTAQDIALKSVKKFTLVNQNKFEFTIFPIICGERNNKIMLERAKGLVTDVIVNSEREGDCNYELLTKQIQESQPLLGCWNSLIKPVFIDNYITNYHVAKNTAILLSAEGGLGIGGVFSLSQQKQDYLKVTNDYLDSIANIILR